MRPKKNDILIRQIREWNDRIWLKDIEPERESTENNKKMSYDEQIIDKISRLKNNEEWNKVLNANKFSTIVLSNVEDIYKFLRYGLEKGFIYNRNITFCRISLFDTYVLLDGDIRESYRFIDDMIDIISNNLKDKYIVVEDLDTEFDRKISTYFITKLIKNGCKGIVFNTNKNLVNTLYKNIKQNKICNIVEL